MQAGNAWSMPAGEFAIALEPPSMRAYLPEAEKERVLVDALRRGTTEGRTARQVVEKLQRVSRDASRLIPSARRGLIAEY